MNHPCRECGASFSNFEQLQQHKKTHESKELSKKTIWVILTVAIVVIILIVVFSMSRSGGQYDELAKCVANSGAKFYGAWWCPHCNDQKKMFGNSAQYLPYIECSTKDRQQTQECIDAGIAGYPTWVFSSGESSPGALSLQVLANKTGCVV